eukprot:4914516-Pleurochrysis_carterae.AAC.2
MGLQLLCSGWCGACVQARSEASLALRRSSSSRGRESLLAPSPAFSRRWAPVTRAVSGRSTPSFALSRARTLRHSSLCLFRSNSTLLSLSLSLSFSLAIAIAIALSQAQKLKS